jgi:hypothetical protein
MKKRKKRAGYLKVDEEIALSKVGLRVWAYSRQGNFLGRVEISRAGVAAYSGTKGGNRLCDVPWEEFFQRVAKGYLKRRRVKSFLKSR